MAGCAPAYAFGVEPNWLERTFHRVKLPCKNLTSGVRILHLSDLHASPAVPFSLIEKSVELGLEAKPDVICLTGDFVTDASILTKRSMHGFFGACRVRRQYSPAWAIMTEAHGVTGPAGFKDTSVVRALLSAGNVPLLHNRSEVVRVRDQSIRFAGVADLWSDDVDGDLAFANVSADDPAILLAHNPDTKDVLADRPWDLMLSGHTHGGQVVLPMLGERFVPVRDKRFIAGLKQWNGRQVYVTRGVGSIRGVRVNCRPEVTVLDLVS